MASQYYCPVYTSRHVLREARAIYTVQYGQGVESATRFDHNHLPPSEAYASLNLRVGVCVWLGGWLCVYMANFNFKQKKAGSISRGLHFIN